MPKLEQLSWSEIRDQLTYIAEDRSALSNEMRERLIARALGIVMERLQGPLPRREDLIERCRNCDGSGWISEGPPGGRGFSSRISCPCQGRGAVLTEAGRAVADAARMG
jgi:hypothetical protein